MDMNIDDLTIGELILFEEVAQKPLSAIGQDPGAKDLQALALIFLRREDPEATWEDAAAVKVSALGFGQEDPTEATG